jgi:hypothetical protein
MQSAMQDPALAFWERTNMKHAACFCVPALTASHEYPAGYKLKLSLASSRRTKQQKPSNNKSNTYIEFKIN